MIKTSSFVPLWTWPWRTIWPPKSAEGLGMGRGCRLTYFLWVELWRNVPLKRHQLPLGALAAVESSQKDIIVLVTGDNTQKDWVSKCEVTEFVFLDVCMLSHFLKHMSHLALGHGVSFIQKPVVSTLHPHPRASRVDHQEYGDWPSIPTVPCAQNPSNSLEFGQNLGKVFQVGEGRERQFPWSFETLESQQKEDVEDEKARLFFSFNA